MSEPRVWRGYTDTAGNLVVDRFLLAEDSPEEVSLIELDPILDLLASLLAIQPESTVHSENDGCPHCQAKALLGRLQEQP